MTLQARSIFKENTAGNFYAMLLHGIKVSSYRIDGFFRFVQEAGFHAQFEQMTVHEILDCFFISILHADDPCVEAFICLAEHVQELHAAGFTFYAVAFHVVPPLSITIGKNGFQFKGF